MNAFGMKYQKPYKLVILGSSWDIYEISYSDIITKNSIYIDSFIPHNPFLRFLFKLHFTPKINRYINLPLKRLWRKRVYNQISCSEPLLIFCFPTWAAHDCQVGFFNYIKKKNKDVKLVCFFQDIISASRLSHPRDYIDFLKIKYDLLISYDAGDCLKYGMTYHHTVFSSVDIPRTQPIYDVLFIGKNKGRVPFLIKLHSKLSSYGLRCKFIVLDEPNIRRNESGEIEYIDNLLKYPDVLEYVQKSRCILELMQPDAVGQTYRTLEAIALNKHLLTNNAAFIDSELYHPSYVSIINSEDDISEEIIHKITKINIGTNPLSSKISPKGLISFIEQKLNIHISY